jgi:outer membrane protein assembly factor BamB
MARRDDGHRRIHLGSAVLTCLAAGAMGIGVPLLGAQPVAASSSSNTIPAGFQDWPMHNHDPLHTGVSAETTLSTATQFKLHWSEQTGDQSFTSPAVVYNSTLNESLVYSGNMDGYFTAYNAATGILVWSYQTVKIPGLSKEIEASPAVSGNTVYFGDGDYHEYALNATTGALICESPSLGGVTASSPVVGDPNGTGDVVYFGDSGPSGNASDGGHLWAMYGVGNTGGTACAIDWSFDDFGNPAGSQTGLSGVWSSPTYAQLANGTNVVVVGSSDNDDAIYEFNAATGAKLWRFQANVGTDSDVGAPPTIAEPDTIGASGSQTYTDGVVYDQDKSGIMYAIDLQTGAQFWSFAVSTIGNGKNPSQSGAALVGNFLYAGYAAGVYQLNATTGALGWVSPVIAGVYSSVSVTGPAGSQVIIIGDDAGNIDVFSLATGAQLFSYTTGGFIYSSAAVSTGQFFINSTDGKLYAFGAASSNASPAVTSVNADQGALGASNLVTITGNAFTSASDVVFGTKDVPSSNTYPCSGSAGGCFEVTSPTQIRAFTPTNLAAGTVDVTVVTPGGTTPTTPADEYTTDSPGAYTAVAPVRICDTRSGSPTPACAGRTLGGRGEINVQITGSGGVPAGAKAVVVNLTAINDTTTPTYVSAFPTGEAVPTVSNINLAGGQVDANLAIVQLSSSGQMTIFNSVGRADAIVDVEGYFAAPSGSPVAGEFHTMPPLRICDSRANMNTECAGSVNDPIQAGTWRRVVLSGLPPGATGGTPSIPTTGAAAAVFNLTGTGGSANTYLSVAAPNSSDACPTAAPKFSNLNPSAGTSLPNRVISTLGPHQDVCVFNSTGSINFVIDVNGWFGNGHESAAGALFYSVPPTRICDTRTGSGDLCDGESLSAGEIQPIHVAGVDVVPAEGGSATPVAVVANLTGVAGSANTVFTLYPSDSTRPRASDLNPSAGQVIANLAIVGIATTGNEIGEVSLFNGVGNIDAILDVAGWFQ